MQAGAARGGGGGYGRVFTEISHNASDPLVGRAIKAPKHVL